MIPHVSALVAGVMAALLATDTLPAQTLPLARIEAVADSAAQAQIAAGLTPGLTVAVARGGEVVFARGYGRADVEMDVGAGPQTVYKVGSITKQFTAALVMRLVENGRMSLDDEITKYLPDYPVQGHHVTIRHLLNHTSGIKAFRVLHEENRQRFRLDLTYQEMVDLYGKQPFEFNPGERYAYNNMAFYLLGEIIARVTGTTYAEHLQRELLGPLGLERTVYCDDKLVIPHRAQGYEYEGRQIIHARYLSTRNAGAAGSLCSTVGDMVRWTHLLHGGQVVSAASLREMTAPTRLASGDTSGYGLGLQLGALGNHEQIYHGGGANGFVSMLAYYPERDVTVAVLANSANARPDQLLKALARAALDAELRDLPVTAEDAARYEGTYAWTVNGAPREMRVHGENGTLMAHPAGGRPFALRSQGAHEFVPAVDDDLRVVFTVQDGRATGFALHESRWDVTRATRTP